MWYIIYRLSIFLVVAFQLCVCLLLIKTHPHVFGRILFPIFHCEHVDPFVYHHFSGWWFGTFYIVPYIVNFIIPTDFHIFQRGKYTTNQIQTNGTQDYSIYGTLYYSICVPSFLLVVPHDLLDGHPRPPRDDPRPYPTIPSRIDLWKNRPRRISQRENWGKQRRHPKDLLKFVKCLVGFCILYIWVHGFRNITYNPARNCYLCWTISKISCGNAQKWCVVLVKLNN